ncbi:Nucleoside 5-triphosphatase RdgB (dHAPTP, dITP,XTP-specific) [Cronobacter dublinensis 582]|nr:Nucleoside 5-triphosphatase RdgB (dHAPTP, dITP,XTP-specific) [Cronobacter dublinensis 582]
MQKVVLATGNAGKVRELASLLREFGLDIVAQTELGVDSAEETGLTFIENAILFRAVRFTSTLSAAARFC